MSEIVAMAGKKIENNLVEKCSLNDLPGICDELERILKYTRDSANIEYFVYTYPAILEERLKNNVVELESLLKEIKSAHLNIQQQKQQQISFAKEKLSLKRVLRKLKENEIHEMETVVSMFDKLMFTRWQTIKNTRRIEALERFLSDVTSKQLALDNLHILVSRKLENLKKSLKTKSEADKKDENDISLIPLTLNNTPESTIPQPPPLPNFPLWNYKFESANFIENNVAQSTFEELD